MQANSRFPFDFAQGRLSTSLRFGRNDIFYFKRGFFPVDFAQGQTDKLFPLYRICESVSKCMLPKPGGRGVDGGVVVSK
jgi:hypothetical protein